MVDFKFENKKKQELGCISLKISCKLYVIPEGLSTILSICF